MLIKEYDRILAEAQEERAAEIRGLEYAISLCESALHSSLFETEGIDEKTFNDLFNKYKNMIYDGIKHFKLTGNEDAVSAAKVGLVNAIKSLNLSVSDGEKYAYCKNGIYRALQNFIKEENKHGFRKGKAGKDSTKADDIVIGKGISGDRALKDKDGGDSGETIFSTTADKRAEQSEKDEQRYNDIKRVIKSDTNYERAKLLRMMLDSRYQGSSNVNFNAIAKDWFKDDPDDKIPANVIKIHGSVEKARENGITSTSLTNKLNNFKSYFQDKLKDLQESKIDVLALYLKEEALLIEGKKLPIDADGNINHERFSGSVDDFIADYWETEGSLAASYMKNDVLYRHKSFEEAFRDKFTNSNPVVNGLSVLGLPAKHLNKIKSLFKAVVNEAA